MKKFKKSSKQVMTILLLLSLFFTSITPVEAKNHNKSSRNRTTKELVSELKDLGMDELSIEDLQKNQDFFNDLKSSEEIKFTEQYVKIDSITNDIEIVTDIDEINFIKENIENESSSSENEISTYATINKTINSYQKQSIVTANTGKKYIDGSTIYGISFGVQWIKLPKYLRTDVFSLGVTDTMSIITNNKTYPITADTTTSYNVKEYIASSSMVWTETASYLDNTKKNLPTPTTKGGIAATKWKLPTSYTVPGNGPYKTTYTLKTMFATMSFYVHANRTGVLGFDTQSEYYHQVSKSEINPSFSFSASTSGALGIGVSFSQKQSQYMEEMTPNLSLYSLYKY